MDCPQCGKEISSEVTQCPQCHVMLDFNSNQGSSEYQEDPPSLDSMSSTYVEEFSSGGTSSDEKGSFEEEEYKEDDNEPLGEDILSEFPEENDEEEGSLEKEFMSSEEESSEDPDGLSYSEPSEDSDDIVSSSEEPASDLSDLEEFANSEKSSAREGEFFYDVTISEIDSEALRSAFEETIADSKFGLDVTTVMNSIKQGSVTIRHINPVKASVLIQRIKSYAFKIDWKQSSIYEP